uniref:Receptor ligand binding region domain-containing protein n=1 Tax=Romanomermis culicivorax TaxID=13658 RepID=A0A915JTI3_ROMCU
MTLSSVISIFDKVKSEVCKISANSVTPIPVSSAEGIRNQNLPPPSTAEFQHPPNLAAVIGPGSSDPSIAVQNLLQVFHIPQIGYSATSSHLSDKIEFKYYMRVVPSDGWQARALVDLVRYFNWTYIAVVYSSGGRIFTKYYRSYGDRGQEEIKNYIDEIGRGTLCTAIHEKIKSLSPEGDYDALLNTINNAKPKPQVAICFCEGATITEILKATRRYKNRQESITEKGQNSSYQSIQWIGSDSWSDRRDVVMNYENEAFGGISLKIYSPLVPKFDDYFWNLSPFTNKLNPWFVDFWEQKFKCSLRETSFALYRRICTESPTVADCRRQKS